MGATVVTNKAVRFLWEQPAEPIFLLYEETYEKNVHPHRPEWSGVGVFRARDALPDLFRWAAVCEGGLLQTRKGATTPEAYLRSWKKAFAHAHVYQGRSTFPVDRSMHGWSAKPRTLEASDVPALTPAQLAAWNAGQTLELILPQDYDALAQLIERAQLARWKVLGSKPGPEEGPAEDFSNLLFRKKQPGTSSTCVIPKWVRLPRELRMEDLYEVDGQVLRKKSWPYSVVSSFVARYAATELGDPGHFEERVRAFRQAAKNAPELDLRTRVQAQCSPENTKYQVENAHILQERFPQGFALSEIDEPARSALHFSGDLRLLA